MKIKSIWILLLFPAFLKAQNFSNSTSKLTNLKPIFLLSADSMVGRSSFSKEIVRSEKVIIQQFKEAGLNQKQIIEQPFKVIYAKAGAGAVILTKDTFDIGKNALMTNPRDLFNTSETTLLQDTNSSFKSNLKDHIVLVRFSAEDLSKDDIFLQKIEDLQKLATRCKASSICIFFKAEDKTWNGLRKFYSQKHMLPIGAENLTPCFLLREKDADDFTRYKYLNSCSIDIHNTIQETFLLKNFIGIIKGTDRRMKNDYILSAAHYDHLGITSKYKNGDSIYNGAKDNAVGCAAMISAIHFFIKSPPKKSLIFVAFSGEEKGLLGSTYYVEHPAVTISSTKFVFNADNVTNNNITVVSLIGLGLTNFDNLITSACKKQGLSVNSGPLNSDLYNRSDNASFVRKKIPSVTFSMGMDVDSKDFGNYHTVSDDMSHLDLNYTVKYINAYVASLASIANSPSTAKWLK